MKKSLDPVVIFAAISTTSVNGEPLNISETSRALGIPRPTAHRHIETLREKDKYIKLRKVAKQLLYFELTAKGKRALQNLAIETVTAFYQAMITVKDKARV